MKYALIGCGRISPNHLEAAINNNLEIVGICDIVPENNRIVEYSLDTANVNPSLENNDIKINGIAKLNLITQDKDTGELESKTIDIMVDQIFPMEDTWKNSNINITTKDIRLNVTQNGNNVDIKVTIYVNINVENIIGISSIQKIEDVPIDLKNISSINIYVVKPGDSIWKIAKKYKTSMENIIKTNKLENPDLIDVGQKILVIR